jgi:hypothetical protein
VYNLNAVQGTYLRSSTLRINVEEGRMQEIVGGASMKLALLHPADFHSDISSEPRKSCAAGKLLPCRSRVTKMLILSEES